MGKIDKFFFVKTKSASFKSWEISMEYEHQLMAMQISPADVHGTTPGKEQQAAGVGILLQIMMLVLSFVLGHVLRRHKFYYLPEASASLLIGMFLILLPKESIVID